MISKKYVRVISSVRKCLARKHGQFESLWLWSWAAFWLKTMKGPVRRLVPGVTAAAELLLSLPNVGLSNLCWIRSTVPEGCVVTGVFAR